MITPVTWAENGDAPQIQAGSPTAEWTQEVYQTSLAANDDNDNESRY